MEALMQYVWQHRLWPPQLMRTVDGRRVQVLDPGVLNRDAGPDFSNAKIKIDGELWAGNVEVHVRASDWFRHGHDRNPAYDSVILHVVDRDDTVVHRSDGQTIPQLSMPCSPTLNADYNHLLGSAASELPCAAHISRMPQILITDWLTALTYERLYLKTDRLEQFRSLRSGDSLAAAFILLARSLGFGINSDPFERLARSIDIRIFRKHADTPLFIEAMLFGQSGLLDGADLDNLPYVQELRRCYDFYRRKFSLSAPPGLGWKMGRMRPANLPHRRIAWLAVMAARFHTLYSQIVELDDLEKVRSMLSLSLPEYWSRRYHFLSEPLAVPAVNLSRASTDLLIINWLVPVLFDIGNRTGREQYTGRAIAILQSLPPERNRLVGLFSSTGIKIDSAATSQALVQLRRCYCETRKCPFCRFGHHYLASRTPRAYH